MPVRVAERPVDTERSPRVPARAVWSEELEVFCSARVSEVEDAHDQKELPAGTRRFHDTGNRARVQDVAVFDQNIDFLRTAAAEDVPVEQVPATSAPIVPRPVCCNGYSATMPADVIRPIWSVPGGHRSVYHSAASAPAVMSPSYSCAPGRRYSFTTPVAQPANVRRAGLIGSDQVVSLDGFPSLAIHTTPDFTLGV